MLDTVPTDHICHDIHFIQLVLELVIQIQLLFRYFTLHITAAECDVCLFQIVNSLEECIIFIFFSFLCLISCLH